jgi:branched-chain amino acid transport system ATP-binding protein
MRTAVMAQVKSMQRTGMAFLVVEHDLAVVAELCSRVVVMAAGRVLTEGTLDEVRSHPDVVGAYLGASQ